MNKDILTYNALQSTDNKEICDTLWQIISKCLPLAENKLWHAHPVWFIEGNPIVGYDKLKTGVRLMFWSGASFEEKQLVPGKSGKFKDASITYTSAHQIISKDLQRWLKKSDEIQWDYKNIVKRKGVLERLK